MLARVEYLRWSCLERCPIQGCPYRVVSLQDVRIYTCCTSLLFPLPQNMPVSISHFSYMYIVVPLRVTNMHYIWLIGRAN